MLSKEEIESFLSEFKEKLKIWGVLFRDDRGKNAQTLADLEIRPIDREQILKELKVEDYSQGPIEDKIFNGSGLWVFGKDVRKKEIYIKITISFTGKVICISFHTAERPMRYPFKNKRYD